MFSIFNNVREAKKAAQEHSKAQAQAAENAAGIGENCEEYQHVLTHLVKLTETWICTIVSVTRIARVEHSVQGDRD